MIMTGVDAIILVTVASIAAPRPKKGQMLQFFFSSICLILLVAIAILWFQIYMDDPIIQAGL